MCGQSSTKTQKDAKRQTQRYRSLAVPTLRMDFTVEIQGLCGVLLPRIHKLASLLWKYLLAFLARCGKIVLASSIIDRLAAYSGPKTSKIAYYY